MSVFSIILFYRANSHVFNYLFTVDMAVNALLTKFSSELNLIAWDVTDSSDKRFVQGLIHVPVFHVSPANYNGLFSSVMCVPR